MTDWMLPAAAGLLALLALGLAVTLLRARSATVRELAAARAETAALRERLARLEHDRRPPVAAGDQALVITRLGEDEPETAPVPTVEGRLFADLVLRETVVQAASLAHGVRRALAPETRHRIRFAMRQELKLARKQRKADLRAAKRLWAEHQRASLDGEGSAA
jgi:hypothetical protein